jgi:hypothetical protein
MADISFTATPEEAALIDRVIDRIECEGMFGGRSKVDLEMDLRATNANGCRLDFQKMLDASPFDFVHDIYGIVRHLNRITGQLEHCFVPRCAASRHAAAGESACSSAT